MVLTSDASISIQSFYASEEGPDISKPCDLLMFVLQVMTGLQKNAQVYKVKLFN